MPLIAQATWNKASVHYRHVVRPAFPVTLVSSLDIALLEAHGFEHQSNGERIAFYSNSLKRPTVKDIHASMLKHGVFTSMDFRGAGYHEVLDGILAKSKGSIRHIRIEGEGKVFDIPHAIHYRGIKHRLHIKRTEHKGTCALCGELLGNVHGWVVLHMKNNGGPIYIGNPEMLHDFHRYSLTHSACIEKEIGSAGLHFSVLQVVFGRNGWSEGITVR